MKAQQASAKPSLEERVAAAAAAMTIDPNKKEDPEQAAQKRAEYEKNTAWLHGEVAALLTALDKIKDTNVFRECIYGCGSNSPGKAWNLKRQALHDQMTPELNAAIELKIAPAALWQLGMAYGRGKSAEAAEIRKEIESALKR